MCRSDPMVDVSVPHSTFHPYADERNSDEDLEELPPRQRRKRIAYAAINWPRVSRNRPANSYRPRSRSAARGDNVERGTAEARRHHCGGAVPPAGERRERPLQGAGRNLKRICRSRDPIPRLASLYQPSSAVPSQRAQRSGRCEAILAKRAPERTGGHGDDRQSSLVDGETQRPQQFCITRTELQFRQIDEFIEFAA